MRGALRGFGLLPASLVALAAAAVGGDDILRRERLPEPKPKRGRRISPTGRRYRNAPWLPASINRNTGKPHEHKAEIARRKRQQARLHAHYMGNGGFTRRGNEAGPI